MAFDKNINYAQEIQNELAKGSGADQAKIAALNAARNEKIAANQDYYSSKGISASDSFAKAADDYTKGSAVSGYNPGITYKQGQDGIGYMDFSKDTTDYSKAMMNARSYEEFVDAAQKRTDKAAAQGIDISGNSGILSNEQLYQKWKQSANGIAGNQSTLRWDDENDYKALDFLAPGITPQALAGTSSMGVTGQYYVDGNGKTYLFNPTADYDAMMQNAATPEEYQKAAVAKAIQKAYLGDSSGLRQFGIIAGDDTVDNSVWDRDHVFEERSGGYYSTQFGTGSGGSGSRGGNGYDSFKAFMDSMGYDDMATATQKAIQAAVQKAVNGYNDQIDSVNNQSDELARQAYVAKMMGQKNLDQQLSANGYAGGMADSQRIATELNYQNQLDSLEKQKQETIKELQSAITDAQLSGDMQTAQELASYMQTLQAQYNSYVMNKQAMENQNYWNQVNLDNDNYWKQQSLAADNANTAYNRVMALIGAGVMPDDAMLASAGLDRGIVQQLMGGTAVPAAGQTGSQGRGGGGYNNGNLSAAQIRQLQSALGVTADGMWGKNSSAAAGGLSADEAWNIYQQNQLPQSPTGGFSSTSYESLLRRGDMEGADNYLAQFWGTMSDENKARVGRIINKYGLG